MKTRWAWVLVGLLGCAAPLLHPSLLEVKELDWGIYEEVDGETVHRETSPRIPCRPDAQFGFRVDISIPGDETVRLPLLIEVREPEIPGVRPASSTGPDELFVISKGIHSLEISATNVFKGESDLVAGVYEVRLIHPETRMAYHSRSFTLENCEARTAMAGELPSPF